MSLFMGLFEPSQTKKASFEDIQFAITHQDSYCIINTLHSTEQDCLIKNTVSIQDEEKLVNDMLTLYETKTRRILIYGKHSNDTTVETKYKQLRGLGLSDVYIYVGGMFEWMLLQDIYGQNEFPTTKRVIDILRYKPSRIIQ
jgi:hypothetical protein